MINSYQTANNAMWLVACPAGNVMNSWDDNCGIFTASDLQYMDQKTDDGNPLSGKLYGFGGYSLPNDCLNVVGGATTPTTASTYKTSNTTPQCQAAYILN